MKYPQFKYVFDNETKMKSAFSLFKMAYNKHRDYLSVKKRNKIEKLLKKLDKELNA